MQTALIAGDTFTYTLDDSTYTGQSDTGVLYLGNIAAMSEVGSDGFMKFTVNADRTKLLPAGIYNVSVRVTRGDGTVQTVRTWSLQVLANPANSPKVDMASRMIELIDKALVGMLEDGEAIESQSLSGRSFNYMSRTELLEERAFWVMSLNRTLNGGTGLRGIRVINNR